MIPLILCGIIVVWILYTKYKKFHPTTSTPKKEASEKKVDKEEKKKFKSSTSSSSDGAWAFVVIMILASAVAYLVHMQTITTSKTSQPVHHPVRQRGTLFWEKPKGVAGRNPKKRNDALDVVMGRNDAKVMAFTADYTDNHGVAQKAHFYWEKHERYGRWYQNNPKGSGLWYLRPVEDKIFEGEVSNDTGNFIKMKLELN